MSATGTVSIPRCPLCNSMRSRIELRPCIGMESEGDTTYMINGSVKRCLTCGHTWDRTASRGIGLKNYPHPRAKAKQPGLLTRLFNRFFPHLK